jgi:hypothetical protein
MSGRLERPTALQALAYLMRWVDRPVVRRGIKEQLAHDEPALEALAASLVDRMSFQELCLVLEALEPTGFALKQCLKRGAAELRKGVVRDKLGINKAGGRGGADGEG